MRNEEIKMRHELILNYREEVEEYMLTTMIGNCTEE
jgi:hypothetical protein